MAFRFVRVPGSDLFRRIEWPGAAYDAKHGLTGDGMVTEQLRDFAETLKSKCAGEDRDPTEEEWRGFLRLCADRYAAGEADGSLEVDDIPRALRELDAKGLIARSVDRRGNGHYYE
jgi:hypothetical protein